MPQAVLTLTLPEEVWLGRLTRSHPAVRFRVLSAFAGDSAGVALVELVGPGFEDVLAAMATVDALTDLDVLQRGDDRALLQFETTLPLLLRPVQDSGTPLALPFEIADGEAVWELTASRDRLSALGEQLDAFGIQYEVDRVREEVDPGRVLTDRQRDLVRAAIEHGYYDTPRTCSLTELADELGLAVSTSSEILHRAEGRVMKRFVAPGDPAAASAE